MALLNNIKSSIYNPSYYSEILNKPFSYSLKYFLSFISLIALIGAIIISINMLPEFNSFINEFGSKASSYYPDNLEVTIRSGRVSTNVQEPYFIKTPAEFKKGDRGSKTQPPLNEMENLLVIDTKSPLTVDLFKNYKTVALLGYDSFAYYDNGAVKIQPLGSDLNAVVTKAKFSAAVDKIMPYLRILPFALVPFIFIFSFIGSVLGNLIYLIFGAFVIWLAFQVMKRKLSYGKAYQVGLHAITLGAILEATIFQFYRELEIPFLFTLIMLVIVWVNLKPASDIDNPPPAPVAGVETK